MCYHNVCTSMGVLHIEGAERILRGEKTHSIFPKVAFIPPFLPASLGQSPSRPKLQDTVS